MVDVEDEQSEANEPQDLPEIIDDLCRGWLWFEAARDSIAATIDDFDDLLQQRADMLEQKTITEDEIVTLIRRLFVAATNEDCEAA